jgi:hypothetical protein
VNQTCEPKAIGSLHILFNSFISLKIDQAAAVGESNVSHKLYPFFSTNKLITSTN